MCSVVAWRLHRLRSGRRSYTRLVSSCAALKFIVARGGYIVGSSCHGLPKGRLCQHILIQHTCGLRESSHAGTTKHSLASKQYMSYYFSTAPSIVSPYFELCLHHVFAIFVEGEMFVASCGRISLLFHAPDLKRPGAHIVYTSHTPCPSRRG